MEPILEQDQQNIGQLLTLALEEAQQFLETLSTRPVGTIPPDDPTPAKLPQQGSGAYQALETFKERFAPWLSGSTGPRYFAFVTGGTTPAALVGDWLTSTYDQNTAGAGESISPQIELETIALLRQLFGLSSAHTGSFVTGATMSNFVGLALARQWLGQQRGINVAQAGLVALGPVTVFSAAPHSSIFKALAMLGIGREAVTVVSTLPNREAIDVSALETALKNQNGQPCVVVANAGTVNTVDFDDIQAIVDLRERHLFWLHVDGAFGGFAACSSTYRHLVEGIDQADSITIDAHKWLNVPYDAAMQFTRHHELQAQVFQNAAVYLGQDISPGNFVHLTPENSRRLRALPAWFSLMAYGRQGYTEIVERNCQLAHELGEKIDASELFELLAPVYLNGVCFTIASPGEAVSLPEIQRYLRILQTNGDVFLTPTVYRDVPAIRISVSNWRTTQKDIDIAWQALLRGFTQWQEQV